MDVWKVSAKEGEVLSKKQDTMDAALMGPVLCKGGFAYAIALESYWLCRMPLAGECVISCTHVPGSCLQPSGLHMPDHCHASALQVISKLD